MLYRTILEQVNYAKKVLKTYLIAGNNYFKTHFPFFNNCALIYIAVKIGLIMLATGFVVMFLLIPASQQLALEYSKWKALLITSPVIFIIIFKIYYIFTVLLTYEKSRNAIQSILHVAVLKSSQTIERIREKTSIQSLRACFEKVVNH